MRRAAARAVINSDFTNRVNGTMNSSTERSTAAMYREMDMGSWLEKAEAELGPPLGAHSKPGLPSDLTT